MKKLFLFIIIITLTGCESYSELNNLGIINKIGIEKNNNYKLYASIINKTEDNIVKEKIIETTGNTISDLINNLSLSLDKKIYLSHLDLLIINDSIKTDEIKELVEYFINNNETRENFLIVNTNNIKEIITNSNWHEINNLVHNNQKESIAIYTNMYDIINNYYLKKPIYLTKIINNNYLQIDGITKIYNNKINHYDQNKSLYINYLLNNINSYKINIPYQNNYILLNIISSNTTYINNKIYITNEIKIINNPLNLKKKDINNILSDYLKKNIEEFDKRKIIINNNIRSFNENN